MVRITQALLLKRAEHNDGILRTLEEIGLHAQGIERIEVLNQACRHLRILYLQNNIIPKIEQLHRLKELEQLNLALNNIQRVQNLQRCESLQRLDLTANFVDKAGLLSLASLRENEQLWELNLMGNPCTKWDGYRPYVVATLPRLLCLDGEQVLPSERIAAVRQLPGLEARLRAELAAEGVDPDEAAQVEDDSLLDDQYMPEETGVIGEDGQLRRPWCPATRVLDQREAEARAAAEEAQRQADRERNAGLFGEPELEVPLRQKLPEIVEGQPVYQKNEGKWEFRLEEAEDGSCIELDVALGRYLDTSAIQADVQPGYVRLLAKGCLLQLQLPAEVAPDASIARRSKTTGNLLITMPVAGAQACLRPKVVAGGAENAAAACNRGRQGRGSLNGSGKAAGGEAELPAALMSVVVAEGEEDGSAEDLPPL